MKQKENPMMNSAVILLSGGLDSLVSLDMALKEMKISLALTFNYGQRAFEEEKEASVKIAQYYGIEHKTVELPFLKEISNCALTNSSDKDLDKFESVWIPNRNGLFLNIAACYCDALNIQNIIFGANKEEAVDFPDNSSEFVNISNEFFKFSTLKMPKVIAPCLQFDKIQIINYAINNNVPLKLLKSCYNSKAQTGKKHCGECMSCRLLYNAIRKSAKPELIEEIF